MRGRVPDQKILPIVGNYHIERHDDTSGLADRIDRQVKVDAIDLIERVVPAASVRHARSYDHIN
jgi:hypothetical protein